MKEIERKFLIKSLEGLELENYRKKRIEQSYLYTDEFTAIRKRMTSDDTKTTYFYTIKTNKSAQYGIDELEKEISEEEYIKLKVPENINVITKDRYYIPLGDLCIELDVFHGVFEGIIFAEIEFPSEEMASNFEFPAWFDKELTRKISNSLMSRTKREDIDKMIAEI